MRSRAAFRVLRHLTLAQVRVHEPRELRGDASAQGAPYAASRTCRSPHESLFAQDTWAKYLKEGMNVNVLTWNGKVSAWSSHPIRVALLLTGLSARR